MVTLRVLSGFHTFLTTGTKFAKEVFRYRQCDEPHVFSRTDIFASLERSGDAVVLQELRDGQLASLTGRQLLAQVQVARAYLRRLRLKNGDRCALLAHNSMQWVAMDLAIMAEGLTAVPLYARQAPAELVAMMKDCWPSVIACGEQSLADAIVEAWPEAPPHFCFENVFTPTREAGGESRATMIEDEDVVADHLHFRHVGRGQRA